MHIRELSILASNKSRRQRKLSHLMREWAFLAEEGDRVDSEISLSLGQSKTDSSHYFYCWTFDKTLRNMLWWIKLGYELGLYDEHEHHMIYWYLDDLHTQRIRNHSYILAYNTAYKPIRNNKKKRAKEKKPQLRPPDKSSHTPYHMEIQAEALICKGIFLLLSVLKRENTYPSDPVFQFGSPQTRFETRFDPFYKMRVPQPHWYKKYEEQCNLSTLTVENFLNYAGESIQNAKNFVERYSHLQENSKLKLDELKLLFKVGIANAMFITLFKKLGATKKPSIDFPYHPAFPIISLK